MNKFKKNKNKQKMHNNYFNYFNYFNNKRVKFTSQGNINNHVEKQHI